MSQGGDEPEPPQDPLRRLGRELRGHFDDELRAEAEERERLAATAARRQRTLADVAAQLCARGDRVRVDAGGRSFVGTLVRAAGDLASVALASGEVVDCNLAAPVALQVVERARAGGHAPERGVASFKARCYEVELEARPVVLGTTLAGEQHGVVTAVAVDHLVLAGDGEWYLPLAVVAYLRDGSAIA